MILNSMYEKKVTIVHVYQTIRRVLLKLKYTFDCKIARVKMMF